MPADKIFLSDTVQDGQVVRPNVHVQWGRGHKSITIGTVWVIEETENSEEVTQAYYVEVTSREAVNRLIQTLRRARDSAFGKDA